MSLIAIAGFYFVLWWLVLFAVLPFFMTRSQDKAGDVTLGTARSAPARLSLGRVVIANTIVTAIIVGAIVFVVDRYDITFDTIANLVSLKP